MAASDEKHEIGSWRWTLNVIAPALKWWAAGLVAGFVAGWFMRHDLYRAVQMAAIMANGGFLVGMWRLTTARPAKGGQHGE